MEKQPKFTIIRSRRKTISVEIRRDLTVVVRAPVQMRDLDIERFLREKESWIAKHLAQVERQRAAALPPFTAEELLALAEQASEVIPQRAAYFASLVGVRYGRITIRRQVSRWGSCSSKGNLNFNCLLMLCPPEVLDYVVVHELCHRKEMNHSPQFWAEVAKVIPDYKIRRTWLKEYGSSLIERIR